MRSHAILEARSEHFRILQVTDLHSDAEEWLNERTRADIRAMAAQWRPDLIAITGDVWCGDTRPETAPMWRERDLAFFGNLGTPWTLVFGNHDYVEDLGYVLGLIAAAPNAVMPPGDGRGNFRIEVRRRKDAHPRWDLFFLNSGPRWNLPGDLAWFDEEATRIHAVRGTMLPGVAFFHIPLRNYQAAIDEGRLIGVGIEEVLHWGDDEGLAAPLLKGPGNLRACFCGHSHKNDFYFEEDGVTFAYGRATGHGGYGGEALRKGATLIELDMASDRFAFKTVFGDGVTWTAV